MAESDVQVEKITTHISYVHIREFYSAHLSSSVTAPLSTHCPTYRHHSWSLRVNHSLIPLCQHTLPLHSLSPEPLSFPIGQSWWHHLMVWHICTKWLVFVYLSKNQGVLLVGEVKAMRRVQESEHTTDSHNTNSTCALSSPHLCTINSILIRDESCCTSVVRWVIGGEDWGWLSP